MTLTLAHRRGGLALLGLIVGGISLICLLGLWVAAGRANAEESVPPPSVPTYDVDVVVFGTQTSGIAAVREISQADPSLRIALVSSGRLLESPLA